MAASPIHHSPVDQKTAWDGSAAVTALDKTAADLSHMYAWIDTGELDENATGEHKKDGYLPHHDVNASGVPGAANIAGVTAAIASLNHAKSKIPEADREATYNHLAAHLKDAGVKHSEIPELKSVRSLVRPPSTADERREAALSFGDQESLVYNALVDHLGSLATGPYGDVDIWIRDVAEDWVVWTSYGQSPGDYKLSYSLSDSGAVAFAGVPQPVVQHTEYVPAPVEQKQVTPQHKSRAHRGLAHQPEFRYIRATGLEIRTGVGGNPNFAELKGQVIVYDVPYEVNDMWGSFTETIHFGAAAPVLARPDLDVRYLFNHSDMPFARTISDTCPLVLEEAADRSGVDVRAVIDLRMQGAADLYYAIDNKLLTGMSVGMEVDPDGDLWSGEDDFGFPDTRDIIRLANIFDASAVTYPASPTTTAELASRAWSAIPAATHERTRRAWEAARDVRAGRGTQAQADAVMHVLERLQEVDGESRDEPTVVDGVVSEKLLAVHKAIADLQDEQSKDPDSNSDPDDKKVASLIVSLKAAADAVTAAQTKDGTDDKAEPPEAKDDESKTEDAGDGTAAGNEDTAPGIEDGTRFADPLAARRHALRERARRLAVERARLTSTHQ